MNVSARLSTSFTLSSICALYSAIPAANEMRSLGDRLRLMEDLSFSKSSARFSYCSPKRMMTNSSPPMRKTGLWLKTLQKTLLQFLRYSSPMSCPNVSLITFRSLTSHSTSANFILSLALISLSISSHFALNAAALPTPVSGSLFAISFVCWRSFLNRSAVSSRRCSSSTLMMPTMNACALLLSLAIFRR